MNLSDYIDVDWDDDEEFYDEDDFNIEHPLRSTWTQEDLDRITKAFETGDISTITLEEIHAVHDMLYDKVAAKEQTHYSVTTLQQFYKMTNEAIKDENFRKLGEKSKRVMRERADMIRALQEELAALRAENEELQPTMVETKTPLYDTSWYVKWFASIVGIFGALATAAGVYPWNVLLGLISMAGWAYVGILWNDRALIVLNIFLCGVYLMSFMQTMGWTAQQ